uniref:LIM zinc-binding domain-containing protein n=1 Tax=Panagrellus redivivus TaxID=6233 RepID=A0A7E4VCG5_PANRE
MKIKEVQHWAEDVGVSTMPWTNRDWQCVLKLLSKVLADELTHRKNKDENGEITFKISFNALLEIAEDVLGIPQLVSEEDLSIHYPNVYLALLTYMLSMKQSLKGIDPKIIKDSVAPKLLFEAKTSADAPPNCVACGLYAFLVERVVVERQVWHRRCFVCATCNHQLFRGAYRSIADGKYECIEHFAVKILSKYGGSGDSSDSGLASVNGSISGTLKVSPVSNGSGDVSNGVSKLNLNGSNGSVKARVPPPRPPPPCANRVSAIIQKNSETPPKENERVSMPEITLKSIDEAKLKIEVETKPIPLPRTKVAPSPSVSKKLDIEKYPDYLNPFGDEEEEDDDTSSEDDYNNSLNPFGDDDEDEEPAPSKPQPSPQPSVASLERPKTTPPPPPKPPRASLTPTGANGGLLTPTGSADLPSPLSRIITLPRAKKTYRAPPPPIPVKRKIEFTEDKHYETLEAVVDELKRVTAEHERLETLGRGIEKELLLTLEKDSTIEWKKNKNVEEWIGLVEQKCSTIRREAVLIHVWLERYLNEIHADCEYQLRCVLEKCEGKERLQEDINREAELLEVLVDIMGLKNGMIENGVDPNSFLDSQMPHVAKSKSDSSKMKKMKIRLKKLKKKL